MVNTTIATGVWQNYSQTGWKGLIVTLDLQKSTLLISALATFVTLVGTRFWAIVAFVIHQLRASRKKKDGVHHQHQVIYRNGGSALGTAWSALKICWAWRGRASWNIPRMLAAILPPLLCFAGFAAASVLSAKVAAPPYTASQVRLAKENCGFLDWSVKSNEIGDVTVQGVQVYNEYFVNAAMSARNYARSCYGSKSQNLASCNVYPAETLPYDTRSNAPCPFKGGRCLLGDTGALEMKTPWLSSHEHFGINAPSQNRIEYRRITTCSVLRVSDLVTQNGKIYNWHLGYVGPLNQRSNITYTYYSDVVNLAIGYQIRTDFAVERDDYPGWIPIPDLKRTDADISAFYFAPNSVVYPSPVEDPFYSAHRKFVGIDGDPNSAYYTSDDFVSVMGCIDQAQLRDPSTNFSTVLSGFQSMRNQSTSIGFNAAQVATAARFLNVAERSMMFNSVNGLGSAALKAQDRLFVFISSGLPADQWKIELQGWFDTALAAMQAGIIEFVVKDIEQYLPYAALIFTPDRENMLKMCDNQIILNIGSYQSFSLMGIEIIAAVGAFIVILSLLLEGVVGFCQRRWGSQGFKELLWTRGSMLQTYRIAAEAAGIKGWEKLESFVPITSKNKVWKAEIVV